MKKKTNLNAVRKNRTKKSPAKMQKSKPAASKINKPAKSPTTKSSREKEFMLRRSGVDKEGNQKLTAIRVYKRKPNGWKDDVEATTAPVGYKWITNGKSLFGGERRSGLMKVNNSGQKK